MNKIKHDPLPQPAPVTTRHDFEPVAAILARLFGKRLTPSPRRTSARVLKFPTRP
jgi:hypothetical protein